MRIQGHRLLLPTINNINIRYNPCFIFAFTSDGGVNVLRKLNESISAAAGYMCRSVLGSPSLLPATIHEKFTIQIRLSYEIRA